MPTIIIPYPGPSRDTAEQDIFVYLRPDTNGVLAESTMLKVIKSAAEYSSAMKLVYMANFPGEFILENSIVEQYYALKFHFAVQGAKAFTRAMVQRFNICFHRKFEDCQVIGAFTALQLFGMNPEELFDTWVAKEDVCIISGQTVKKIGDRYVVNYDIPALLDKYRKDTDIAIMAFRTKLGYSHVKGLVGAMHIALVDAGIINQKYDPSRAFHYSKGPLEQVMDGAGYVFTRDRAAISLKELTFSCFLLNEGISMEVICGCLLNPIAGIEDDDGELREINLFDHTAGMNYRQALSSLKRIRWQEMILHHGPLLQSICPCFS